jgi:methylamine methyltransferase corrinoid protein reductive activase
MDHAIICGESGLKESYGIAIDVGTSGLRAQAIDLNTDEIISTAITLRHPLPGANVMDHLHFAVEVGLNTAHSLIIDTINRLLSKLDIDLNKVERVAVSGNPTQLSIFQNIEIRDLAYWGKHALERRSVKPPSRNAVIVDAGELGLKLRGDAQVYIPPAIRHEVGADALAMLVEAKVLDKEETAVVIDFGTNAEIALCADGEIYTASAAAGPAIEGQRIEKGMLASPGAVCDVNTKLTSYRWENLVLDNELFAQKGDVVNPTSGEIKETGMMHGKAIGITGTGVIAIISEGIEGDIIARYKINTPDRRIHVQGGLYLTEKDVEEAGKALGAFRAGVLSVFEEARISLEDLESTYMAGASGFYVDAYKSIKVGQIPANSTKIYQIGNTSLAMAREIVSKPEMLDYLQEVANQIRGRHIMLATSKAFAQIYPLELAHWQEGMPLWQYDGWLRKYGYQGLPEMSHNPQVHRLFARDIPTLGVKGLRIVRDIGVTLTGEFAECTGCATCEAECPEKALMVETVNGQTRIIIKSELCLGIACLRCQRACPNRAFKFSELLHKLRY